MLQFHKKLLGFVIEFNVSLNKKKIGTKYLFPISAR